MKSIPDSLRKFLYLLVSPETMRICAIFCAGFYIFLCVLHFLSGRPLWTDENFIYKNLLVLGPDHLFGKLNDSQGFPRFYLFAVDRLSRPFHFNLYALRLLSFICMMGAFFVWIKNYLKEEGYNWTFVLFLLSWCGSHYMTYYAAELKQYSGDLLVAGLLTYWILQQRNHLSSPRLNTLRVFTYALIPFVLLVSYTGYFLILVPLYNLLMSLKRSKQNIIYAGAYTLGLIIAGYLSYMHDIRFTRTDAGLQYYWDSYFISTASFASFMETFWEGTRRIFVRWFLKEKLIIHMMAVFLPFAFGTMVYNGITQMKKDKGLLLSLKTLTPFLVTGLALAGILKVYPYTAARITLYIAPFIIYTIIQSIMIWKKKTFWLYVPLASFYTIILCGTSGYLFMKYVSLLRS